MDRPSSPRIDLVSLPPCICDELYRPHATLFHPTWASRVGLYGVHRPVCDGSAEGWVVVPPDDELHRPYVYANRPQARDALVAVLCVLGLAHRCSEIEVIESKRSGEYNVFRLGEHGDYWEVLSSSRHRAMHRP